MNIDPVVKIYAVEDDPTYSRFLAYVFGLNPDYQVSFFESGGAFLRHLHEKPDIVTLDYSLPDKKGEELLREIKQFDPGINVIMVSSQEDIGTAVDLLKMGAYDYVVKNEDTKERLLYSLNNARKNIQLVKELNSLKQEVSEKYDFGRTIIGNSKAIKKVYSLLEKAIKTNITVSITGETGTGKEMVAKAIHYNSPRKKLPFVPVNIAAIPSELIESELFGHEKGAFTGATTRRIGKFEEANEGTIFLDEIGEIPLNLQAKLLRVIQEREVTRIGGSNTVKLNVRILVATHKDLAEEVKNGRFREDLYYRLLGLPIWIPPLRDRENDVILIANHFLKAFCKENDISPKTISRKAKEKLLGYPFPGNVRELKSVIELATVMSNEDELQSDDIRFSTIVRDDAIAYQDMTLKELNFKIIRSYLEKYNNNIMDVARRLDIGKSTIYRYLKEMEDLQI